jgi:cation/acetate symporter
MAAATTTLAVCLFYLLAQMAGAGGLVALLLNITSDAGQALVIAVVGLLMIVYVLIGGMKGTTWVQIIKAVLLIGGAAMMTVWVLAKFGANFSDILGAAQTAVSGSSSEAVAARDVLAPGAQYGASLTSQINFISLALALVLGTAGLPHVLMRFYTVPTAKEARRSVVWAIVLIGAFYLFTLALGYGAAALVGPDKILAAPGGQNAAAPLLAFELGGVVLLGIISAVAFATILAVVAGLTITAATSFAHDIYASVLKHNKVTESEQVRVSRITVVVLGILSIGLGILAAEQNIAFLVALAFAVAAAANLPTIIYSLYWPRFNTRGALWSMYGGLISTIVLIIFSPAVSGAKTAMLPNVDFAWFPLANPGIVSIPLAFILGIVGTLTSSDRGDPEINAEFEVRCLTGVGAEKAVRH